MADLLGGVQCILSSGDGYGHLPLLGAVLLVPEGRASTSVRECILHLHGPVYCYYYAKIGELIYFELCLFFK